MQNLSALSSQVGDMVSGLQKGQGTLGKLLTDQTAYNRMNSVLARVDQMTASIQQGQGTIGKLVASDELYGKLRNAAVEVLYDDRDESPGAKFATMDLIGLPEQIVVGPRGLVAGTVETKDRRSGIRQEMSIDTALSRLTAAWVS